MRIFSFFKKPKEKIDIKVPEFPTKFISKASDDEIYYERAEYIDDRYNLDDCFDVKTKVERILESLRAFDKKAQTILHKYYFLKLFAKVASRDAKYNEKMITVDKQVNRMKKIYDEIKKRADVLKYLPEEGDFDYNELFMKINDLFDYGRALFTRLSDIQKQYYQNLKIAAYSLCKNKTHQELEQLLKETNETIQQYKSPQEAYDFIYYNSGELIVNTVKALVDVINESGIKNYIDAYQFQYFLASDDVVALRFAEWIDLFNKLLYVIRNTNRIDYNSAALFNQYYRQLETRYMIMLIYNEMGLKQ